MEKRVLKKTGYNIAPVVFGGITVTDELQEDANRYVAYAVERGVNYFDVAPSYGNAEERLGPALAPYRKNVFLACKTVMRDSAGAKEELINSLRFLKTDYFDVYQLHAIDTDEEIDVAFSEGGVMDTLQWAQEEGIVRKLGITSHSEKHALRCLELYDFDTVLYPMYWAQGVARGAGDKLTEVTRAGNIGLLCMKALTYRNWMPDEAKPDDARQWYKYVEYGSAFALAVLKYGLSKGDALVGPGNFEALCYMLDNIDEAVATPFSAKDFELLSQEAEKIKGYELQFG